MKNSIKFLPLIIVMIFTGITLNVYPVVHSVNVQDFTFNPANITNVRPGDTVRWVWVNGSHTTTSTTIPSGAGTWDHLIDASHLTFDYVPTVPGVYHYKCTPHAASGMIAQFTVLDVTGIRDQYLVPKITLYPNPIRDKVMMNCVLPDGVFIQRLMIYDVTGKIIREASFGETNTFPESLDLSGVPPGMMVFEFIDNLNRTYTLRAVLRE